MRHLIIAVTLLLSIGTVRAGWDSWTPQQQTDFRDALTNSPYASTPKVARWMNYQPRTVTAATNTVARGAYDFEEAIRDIVVARYGPLSQYSGLSVKDRFFLLRANLKAALTDAVDQPARNQVLHDGQDIKSLNDMAKEREGGMSHSSFLVESLDVISHSVSYGQSRAQAIGILDKITSRDVEASR